MQLGLFMQPIHPPSRDYGQVLEEDREAIRLADALGYSECWIGEHFTAAVEPITVPLTFCATLIHETCRIRFGTGVTSLPMCGIDFFEQFLAKQRNVFLQGRQFELQGCIKGRLTEKLAYQ